MVIELSQLVGLPVVSSQGERVGVVRDAVFGQAEVKLYGFRLNAGLTRKDFGLAMAKTLVISRQAISIDQKSDLTSELKDFDRLAATTGPIVGVKAKTAGGKILGKVSDLDLESESGLIVRLHLRNLLTERIIPRQYLISVSPKEVIFQDIVDTPVFDQVAAMQPLATP